jgi:oligopeptide transport system permease protein
MKFNESGAPKKNPLSLQIDLEKFKPATEEEKRQQDVMSKSTSFFKDGLKKLLKNPLAVISVILLGIILLTIIIAPLVVPYGYEQIISVDGVRDKGAKNLHPFEWSELEQQYIDEGGSLFPHIFGTDAMCRDYFIRCVYATRVSLFIGMFASLIVLVIGVI